MVNEVSYISNLLQTGSIVHDCDPGFDMDDFGAVMFAALSARLKAILTCLYEPGEKKEAVIAFLKVYIERLTETSAASSINEIAVRVFAGEGYYKDSTATAESNLEYFLSQYPRWPTNIFGSPVESPEDPSYRCIYPHQLKAFQDNNIALGSFSKQSELPDFINFLKELQEPIVYVSTGPTTNLAALLQQEPDLVKAKIKAVVMMGGTHMDPPRMGYNGGLNLHDTEKVFDSGIPCIVVPSGLCANYNVPKELMEEIAIKRKEGHLSKFGALFYDIMHNWEVHRARKRNPNVDPSKLTLLNPILADPLTMLIAIEPELIESARRIKYTFNHAPTDIHMLHKEAQTLVTISEDPNSNVYEVTSLISKEQVMHKLIEKLIFSL